MAARKLEFVKFRTAPVILISGGASALAYYVAKLLLSSYKKIKIISIDNLETGSADNIKEFKGDDRYSFIKYDLNKGIPENMPSVDCILHLAAVREHSYEEDVVTLDSLLTNAFATKNLLELARANKARFLLASSINVYQGVLSSLNLRNYFGPTSQIEKKFSHIEAKRYAEALCWEYYKKYDINLRIVRLGELYGPKVPLYGYLGSLLRQVIEDGLITIKGDGLEKERYAFVEDAAEAIARAELLKNTRGKIFPVSYDKSASVVELSYLIKAVVSKEIKITTVSGNVRLDVPDIKNISRENLRFILWKPKTSLEEGIKKTLKFYGFSDIRGESLLTIKLRGDVKPAPSPPTLSEIMKASAPRKLSPAFIKRARLPFSFKLNISRRKVAFGAVALLGYLIFPTFFYFANLYLGASAMSKAMEGVANYDAVKVEKYAYRARKCAISASEPPPVLSFVSGIFQKRGFLESSRHFSSALYYSSEAMLSSVETAKVFGKLFISSPNIDFGHTLSGISKTEEFLMLAKAEYANVHSDFSLFHKQSFSDAIERYVAYVTQIRAIVPSLKVILGYDKKVSYLILIQNSTEITPLGGVVSSLAKVTLENGKITDIVVENVSDMDIGNALDTPAFPEAASEVVSLYKASAKEDLDGVFAVDLAFIKSMLDITGPLFLSYYDTNITSDNIYEKSQFYTEYGISADSQKKNFLSTAVYKISDNLFTLSNNPNTVYAFLKALDSALNEKHFLVYSADSNARNVFYRLNWCGDMASYNGDYIYAMDTNIGATRSNMYIEKKLDYSLEKTREDLYRARLKIVFTHTGKSNAWPGGAYKNLLKVYVPQGSQLDGVTYDNKIKIDITKDITPSKYRAFTVFPIPVQVGAGETSVVEIGYFLPKYLSDKFSSSKKYNLTIQKQPGVGDIPLNMSFKFSDSASAIVVSRILDRDEKIDIRIN